MISRTYLVHPRCILPPVLASFSAFTMPSYGLDKEVRLQSGGTAAAQYDGLRIRADDGDLLQRRRRQRQHPILIPEEHDGLRSGLLKERVGLGRVCRLLKTVAVEYAWRSRGALLHELQHLTRVSRSP